MDMFNKFQVDNKVCVSCLLGDIKEIEEIPVIYMPGGEAITQMLPDLLTEMKLAVQNKFINPFLLIYFESDDWNREFTPWPASAISKKSTPFIGAAGNTLDWMIQVLKPNVEQQYSVTLGKNKNSILGYSLGGLFAIWAFCENDMFNGCASCSGSLWYDGWFDYIKSKSIRPDSRIYLSLGEEEHKTRNKRMSNVETITREMAVLLEENNNVSEVTLQWHKGGHFDHVSECIFQAFQWLLKK